MTAALIAAGLLAGTMPLAAKVETIKGRLVDKACYERSPQNTGEKHLHRPIDECASTCAKVGLPLAVLTADGKLYQVTGELTKNKNEKLLAYVTHMVELRGEVGADEEGGLLVTATDVKPLKE